MRTSVATGAPALTYCPGDTVRSRMIPENGAISIESTISCRAWSSSVLRWLSSACRLRTSSMASSYRPSATLRAASAESSSARDEIPRSTNVFTRV